MGVDLYKKKEYDEFISYCKKIDNYYESNKNSSTSDLDIIKLKNYLYVNICMSNSLSLRYSEWGDFLTKYIWSFFDKNEISTMEFNSDNLGTITSKNMKLLTNHLKTIKSYTSKENEIKDFLLKNVGGISYE